MAPEKPAVPTGFEQSDEMFEAYANNVYYEPSAWDLKLVFGQLDQQNGVRVVQHTAITIPWPLAKLMVFWLRGQVEAHESIDGPIHVPPAVVPIELPPPTDEIKKSDRNAELYRNIYARLREEFIANLK